MVLVPGGGTGTQVLVLPTGTWYQVPGSTAWRQR